MTHADYSGCLCSGEMVFRHFLSPKEPELRTNFFRASKRKRAALSADDGEEGVELYSFLSCLIRMTLPAFKVVPFLERVKKPRRMALYAIYRT